MHDTIVSKLAAGYTDKVYLPTHRRGGGAKTTASMENYATRPDVQSAAAEYFESDQALHGDAMPTSTILTEKPIHRMMIYLHASGASYADIAAQTGFTTQSIRTVLSQPWARSRLVQILNETGRDRVKHFLTHEVAPSLEVLRDIRDSEQARASDKIAASREILDRALGKSTVHIESENTTKTVSADVSAIDRQIESVRKQLAEKGVDSAACAN